MKRRAALFGLWLALLGQAAFLPTPSLAASLPLYTVDATVEYDVGIVTARETIAFTNQSSQSLDSLFFNVTPAFYGSFQLLGATVNAIGASGTLDGSILEMPLTQAIRPGASVVAALDFKLKLPRQGGRFGKGPQALALGNWLPLLAVYRDGRLLAEGQERGWARDQYVETGDAFFSQTGDFLVNLRSDRPLTVAHTGDLVSQEESAWKFEARGVREFALALSPSFASVSQVVDGVNVSAFYFPGHEAIANTYLKAAVETVSWMKRTLIPYPYRNLHIAEINAAGTSTVGQEYPNLILMSDGMASGYGSLDSNGGILAIHEVAHQFYYGIVGNDQLYEPWLDEALATWLSYHLLRASSLPSFSWIWQARVVNPLPPSQPVNTSIYDYAGDNPYFSVVYRRGALFLEELYQAMGEEAFFTALKKYSTDFSGRIATPYALLDTMQAHTEVNLNPIIRRYFSYPRYQASEPLRVSAKYPQQEWSGPVKIVLESNAPLREVQVFVDDSFYMLALPAQVIIETGQLDEGRHLLSLRASDGQREVDIIGTFVVKQPPPPPPPPPSIPAPTAVPVEAPSEEADVPPMASEVPVTSVAPETRAAGVTLITLSVAALALGLSRTSNHDDGR